MEITEPSGSLLDGNQQENVLFASEIIGAVKGIDPETGFHFDDTRRYIDAVDWLQPADRAKIFEGNARRIYPRLDAKLAALEAPRSFEWSAYSDAP